MIEGYLGLLEVQLQLRLTRILKKPMTHRFA